MWSFVQIKQKRANWAIHRKYYNRIQLQKLIIQSAGDKWPRQRSCLHYISQNVHSHLFFSNLLYMPLGGKWQTILLEVILNSKLYKTYSHLKVKVISLVFYIKTPNFLYIYISYLLYMCKYTCHEISCICWRGT